MKKIANILLYILFIILILFSFYQNKQLTRVKKDLGNYYIKNFEIIKYKTDQIYRYIKTDNLDSDKLLAYSGTSAICLDIAQDLSLGRMPAYFYDISNRLEDFSNYIRKNNPDKKLLIEKKRELVLILETLQESYKFIENENGKEPIKWYENNFNMKHTLLFKNKVNEFFNEKAKDNKILEIH